MQEIDRWTSRDNKQTSIINQLYATATATATLSTTGAFRAPGVSSCL